MKMNEKYICVRGLYTITLSEQDDIRTYVLSATQKEKWTTITKKKYNNMEWGSDHNNEGWNEHIRKLFELTTNKNKYVVKRTEAETAVM